MSVLTAVFLAGLKSKRRFAEAGRVLLEYARDVEAAVEALVEGGEFTEALRLVRLPMVLFDFLES